MDQKMDKEIEAKVEELLKSYDKRKLSLEEMDKVSGGGGGLAAGVDGKGYDFDFVVTLGQSMAEGFGFDVAADTLCAMFGINPYEKNNCGGSFDVDTETAS